MIGKCAACGARCDGDVCDWICETRASDAAKWRGKEPCTVCVEHDSPNDWEPATVGELCSFHEEQRNEAAYERQVEDYYGSSAPQTAAEHIGRTR